MAGKFKEIQNLHLPDRIIIDDHTIIIIDDTGHYTYMIIKNKDKNHEIILTPNSFDYLREKLNKMHKTRLQTARLNRIRDKQKIELSSEKIPAQFVDDWEKYTLNKLSKKYHVGTQVLYRWGKKYGLTPKIDPRRIKLSPRQKFIKKKSVCVKP